MKSWQEKLWGEGKYVDFWSISHFLFGPIAASITILLSVEYLEGFMTALLIMAAWEVFEKYENIKEHRENKVWDILLGVIGFILAYNYYITISQELHIILFAVILIIWAILNLWGMLIYAFQLKPKKKAKKKL